MTPISDSTNSLRAITITGEAGEMIRSTTAAGLVGPLFTSSPVSKGWDSPDLAFEPISPDLVGTVSQAEGFAVGDRPADAIAVGQVATGNPYIDGLLRGVKWSGTITFSFPQLATQYGAYPSSEPSTNFAPVTFQQAEATRAIMIGMTFFPSTTNVSKYGSFNNIILPIVEENGGLGNGLSGLGDIRLGESTLPPTAWAYYPSNQAAGQGGDVWFGTNYAGTVYDYRNPVLGGYSYHTHIHEFGHAFGLKHSHEQGGPANVAVPTDRDAIEFTVMSYRSYVGGPSSGGYTYETWGAPQTLMMLDILALQMMYGANYGTNSGNTTYSWSPSTGEMFVDGAGQGTPGGNRVFLTIWDGGGIDTYDMSNYTNNVSIDLAPGSWSVTSDTQRAYLGGGNYANGTVYNSLLFDGNVASLIENANGGSGNDLIKGNQLANVLIGNAGNDQIYGFDGNDSLQGGNGHDYLDGGNGNNTLVGGNGNDTLVGGNGNDGLNGGKGHDVLYGNAGDDTLVGANGNDGLIGGAGHDYLDGGAGDDSLDGEAGDDSLVGEAGNDGLVGGAGHDTLDAGDGNDSLIGGLDMDWLVGGTGDDIFMFARGEANGDQIGDFVGNDAAGDLLIFTGYGSGASFVQLNASQWQIDSGDGLTHEVITFLNGTSIHETDFMFA
jgi:serralysin